jgi:hypothetical protein
MFDEVLGAQHADHASISSRRFSGASLRREACSALSPVTWASAVSAGIVGYPASILSINRLTGCDRLNDRLSKLK